MSHPLDMKKIGPGIWWTIHRDARNADNEEKFEAFCIKIRELHFDFPCMICKRHFGNYLEKNPPEKYKNMFDAVSKEYVGAFVWTVEFHNAVNARLEKKIVSLPEAYTLFPKITESCTDFCGI
jgi:hypothetical protein